MIRGHISRFRRCSCRAEECVHARDDRSSKTVLRLHSHLSRRTSIMCREISGGRPAVVRLLESFVRQNETPCLPPPPPLPCLPVDTFERSAPASSVSPSTSSKPPRVYVFGNRYYPFSTAKSAKRQPDYSRSLADVMKKGGNFDGIFERLSPEAQE